MSLDVTEALASGSNVYTWEPPDRVLAARYGLDPADILRFDLNTSPAPPEMLAEALAGPFDPPINEYPDSTYAEFAELAAEYVGVEDHGELSRVTRFHGDCLKDARVCSLILELDPGDSEGLRRTER